MFGFLRRLLSSQPKDCSDDFVDDEVEYFSYDEAIAFAKDQAIRELTIEEAMIHYVAYVKDYEDYCFCEWVNLDKGWVLTVRNLTNQERLPEEQITDNQILTLFKEGKKLLQFASIVHARGWDSKRL